MLSVFCFVFGRYESWNTSGRTIQNINDIKSWWWLSVWFRVISFCIWICYMVKRCFPNFKQVLKIPGCKISGICYWNKLLLKKSQFWYFIDFFHRGEEVWCLCAIFGSMVEAQVFGGKALIPTMKAFVKMHVVYIMILAFCGLRIRKHYFE